MPPLRDPFANFERMRREMDELFGVFERRVAPGAPRSGFSPAVDVAYSEDPPRVVVTVDLAGVSPEELSIDVEGRELAIRGRRNPPVDAGSAFHQVEIERGPFRRVIPLGADVAAEAATAEYEDGMLRIELPLVVPGGRSRSVPLSGAKPAKRQEPA
jgi:HSP20 family protein